MPGMRQRAERAARQTDRALQARELQLLLASSIDWEALRPDGVDPAVYDGLIEAVQQATQHNESVAQLHARLAALGDATLAAARLVSGRL